MVLRATVLAALLTISALFSFGVNAQPSCGPSERVLARFEREYGEVFKWSGIAKDGSLVTVLESPKGTWTMFITRPGAMMCLVEMGGGDAGA